MYGKTSHIIYEKYSHLWEEFPYIYIYNPFVLIIVARVIPRGAGKDVARNSGQRPFQRLPGIMFWGGHSFFSQAAFVLDPMEKT